MRRSASRVERVRVGLRLASHDQGADASPAIQTRLPRSSISTPSSRSSVRRLERPRGSTPAPAGRVTSRRRGSRARRTPAAADADELAQARLAARVRQQVAGDRDEIRLPLRGPVDRSHHRARRRATARRGGSPRGARCAARRARAAGPRTSSSSSRSRTQPASNEPQPSRSRWRQERSGAAPEGSRAGVYPTIHEMPHRRQTCATLRLRASRAPAEGRRCAA